MDIIQLLTEATEKGASDIFIVAGLPLSYKINGIIQEIGGEKLYPPQTEVLVQGIYDLAGKRSMEGLVQYGDDDFSFAIKVSPFPCEHLQTKRVFGRSGPGHYFLTFLPLKIWESPGILLILQTSIKALFSLRVRPEAVSPPPWPA